MVFSAFIESIFHFVFHKKQTSEVDAIQQQFYLQTNHKLIVPMKHISK